VQVGTFANTENAEHLREKLTSHGYAVNAESVTFQGNKATRLRVGPFHEKSAAAKAQAQLQKELNIQGMVLAYP
jgi:DedD protein